jgi:agmatine deiminase
MNRFGDEESRTPIRIPAEWEPHSCCWMAWAVHPEWLDWVDKVKSELSEVIRTVAQFECVRLLTPTSELADARARFSGRNVEIVEAHVDDIWMRDIAPTFVVRGTEVVAIDWNFNGWGSTKDRPSRPGDQLAKTGEGIFGVPRISMPIIADAGALITDGAGTVIASRSCLLNPNRNLAHVTEKGIEHEFAKLGMAQTIWLEGDPSEPITSGHVDGYVLFKWPGAVLVEGIDDQHLEPTKGRSRDIAVLEQATDSAKRPLSVEKVLAPRKQYWKYRGEMFAPCYLNAYVANGVVISGRFGDVERDEAAQAALESAFPGRDVVMLKIDHIAAGGGGVHCLTQPMPSRQQT